MPETFAWLYDRALNDRADYVRNAAVKAVVEGWRDKFWL
jgi:hypothetical protein